MYQQLLTPNLGITYTGGWCLKAVQDAFGTDHPYPTAIVQWDGAGTQHQESPPTGFYVPVFFSLDTEPAGHIAIALPDGRVASSTQSGTHTGLYIHPNLDDLIKVYRNAGWSITYLGWKDTVGTMKVIQEEDTDVIGAGDVAPVRIVMSEVEGWDMNEIHSGKDDAQIMAAWQGQKWQDFISHGWEVQSVHRGNLTDQITGLNTQVTDLNNQVTELSKRPETVEVPVDKIVYQDKIVEVNKGDADRTFGDLLSAAFKQLFKGKK